MQNQTRLPGHLVNIFVALCLAVTSLADTPVRMMTGNITSGNRQSYDEGHGARIFQAFKPDVALIQEFNFGDNSPRAIRQFVDMAFGHEYEYVREELKISGAIPNGIVSRFRILDAGVIDDPTMPNRNLSWAKLDVPGPHKLWVFSVHFSHGSATARSTAAQEIVKFIDSKIPDTDYVALGGDLNTTNRQEGCIRVLAKELTDARVPKDQDGRDGTNTSRSKPYDLLLPSPNLNKYHRAVEVKDGMKSITFPDGLVFDSRTFKPLSAVKPVQAGDSGSKNMQHMAVIKDFLLPD